MTMATMKTTGSHLAVLRHRLQQPVTIAGAIAGKNQVQEIVTTKYQILT